MDKAGDDKAEMSDDDDFGEVGNFGFEEHFACEVGRPYVRSVIIDRARKLIPPTFWSKFWGVRKLIPP